MTLGEKLLDLSREYDQSKAAHEYAATQFVDGKAYGRDPKVIAAEYAKTVKQASGIRGWFSRR